MKIGLVLDDTLDTADGVQQYILSLGTWLSQHDHEVHYLVARSHRTDIANLHTLSKHLRVKFNRNVVPLTLPTSPKAIASLLAHERFDVLHIQMPYNPAFGARVISLAPHATAVVGTFHIAPYARTEKALSKVLGYWLKPTVRHFDAVMSVSGPAQQLAEESFGLHSVIVPNMVDIQSYRLKTTLQQHQPPHIIFVGRLVQRKGCEHFIKSLPLLTSSFRATIVGDGNQRARLEKLVTSEGISDKVTFVGFVSEAKKRQLLASADMAVFPATGGESFGIVLIEAMAAGSCVVLAGNNPGYTSVLGKLPHSLVEPTNHKLFANTIETYLTDRTAAQQLYTAQQKLVREFDVPVVASKVLAVYKKAVAKRLSRSHTKE